MTISSQQDQFKQALALSLSLHGILILFSVLKVFFFTSTPINYQSAVRVDIVALPEKMTSPTEPTSPEKEPESLPKVSEKSEPEPVAPTHTKIKSKESPDFKKKQSDALSRLKALSALEKISKEVSQQQQKKIEYKGNILSKGSELVGVLQLQHDDYVASVKNHILSYWTLPEWLTKKNYRAQVLVKIDENGNLIQMQLTTPSRDSSFNDSVLNTVQKSVPLPRPPEKFVRILSHEGILIGFPE